jgi:hypothetical protein
MYFELAFTKSHQIDVTITYVKIYRIREYEVSTVAHGFRELVLIFK